jgi:tetratricopeptide (TPR) repeat protein
MMIEKESVASTRAAGQPTGRSLAFAVVSLLVMLLIIYGNSFFGEWHFDDYHNIVDNRNVHLQTLSWDDIQQTFYGTAVEPRGWYLTRPLSYLTFGLNYFLGGTYVFGYHVVNFLIHCFTAVFLFLLVFRTLKLPLLRDRYGDRAYDISLLATFLWAINPMQVNAVAIIVQRMAAMAGLGYVMALYCFVRARTAETGGVRWGFTACSAASALLAFGSKENAAMLPVSILLFEVVLIQGATRECLARVVKFSWIPLALTAGLAILFSDFLSGIFQTYEVRPFTMTERLLTAPRILIFYVSLLLYPIPSRLAFLHDIEISRSLVEPWTTLPAVLAVVLAVASAIWFARRKPLLSYCVLFFFLNHLIEGTVIPLELIFEHRNYIPSMLFFVPVAIVMIHFLDHFSYNKGLQYFLAGGLALLLAFQGHTTFGRNDIVRSDLHLWLDNVRKAPNLSRPRINLARHYYEAGMYDEAYRELKIAEELNRDTNLRQIGLASYNLGVYHLYLDKDIDRAEQQFLKALQRFSGYPSAIAGLATVYLRRGETGQAWALLREYAPENLHSTEIANASALVLLKQGEAKGALRMAARSMTLKWNSAQPWEISGEAWRMQGQWRKAAQCWEEVLRLNPQNPRAHLALVELYDRLQEGPELSRMAVRCFVLKGNEALDEWLKTLARESGAEAYAFDPAMLSRIIKREIGNELKGRKGRSGGKRDRHLLS